MPENALSDNLPQVSRIAVTSFFLTLISLITGPFLLILVPIDFILGIVALKDVKKYKLRGGVFATISIILNGIGISVFIIFVLLFFAAYSSYSR